MIAALISFFFLILFAELASANIKRLAPVLEAWEQSRKQVVAQALAQQPYHWLGGWERLSALFWALGQSLPLLAFSIACYWFLENRQLAVNLSYGSFMGFNIVALSVMFSLVLFSGPLTFFRVRSVASPVFLLLATLVFTYCCLNQTISTLEGVLLLLLIAAYGIYFRTFSQEWKHFEKSYASEALLESAEGLLPVAAVFCMGCGFFGMAVLAAFPFVRQLSIYLQGDYQNAFRIGIHFIALGLSIPSVFRTMQISKKGSIGKAIAVSSISHSCLLNVLLVPGLIAFLGRSDLSPKMLLFHLPVLLAFTGTFVSTLLIEKETGGKLTWILLLLYLAYFSVGSFL